MKTFKGLVGLIISLSLLLHHCLAGNHFSFDQEEYDYEEEDQISSCPPGQVLVHKPEGVICMVLPPNLPIAIPERNPDRIVFEEDSVEEELIEDSVEEELIEEVILPDENAALAPEM